MSTVFLLLLGLPTLAAAAWAHRCIRTHAASTRLVTHFALLLVGLGFAWVITFIYTNSAGLDRLLVFVISFGVVHIPAAVILQLKQIRHRDYD